MPSNSVTYFAKRICTLHQSSTAPFGINDCNKMSRKTKDQQYNLLL